MVVVRQLKTLSSAKNRHQSFTFHLSLYVSTDSLHPYTKCQEQLSSHLLGLPWELLGSSYLYITSSKLRKL